MDSALAHEIATLIHRQRWAALATLNDAGKPHASMVGYSTAGDLQHYLLHLSRLAPHTRYLLAEPQVSLVISEPDDGRDDPQTLARLTIDGHITALPPDHSDYAIARQHYLATLPAAEPMFEFGDFALYRLHAQGMRYVGGFARARSLSPVDLVRLASGPGSDAAQDY